MPRYLVLMCLIASAASAAPKMPEARKLLQTGQYPEARKAYEMAADKAVGAVGLAKVLRETGEYEKADAALTAALKDAPKNADLLAARAELVYNRGEWEAAEQLVADALAVSPDHFLARYVRASILRDRGDWDKASDEFRWFVRTYSRRSDMDDDIADPDELMLVGFAGAENARHFALADQFKFIVKELYPDVLKLEKTHWRADYQTGILLLEKFNRAEAVLAFEDALKINPDAAEAIVGKALVAYQAYQLPVADELASRALKINPRLPSALRVRADVAINAAEYATADEWVAKALAVNPRDEKTQARKAALARLRGKEADEKAVRAEVEKFCPKPVTFLIELAGLLDDRRRFDEADAAFAEAVKLQPKSAAALSGLGMIRLRLAKEDAARTFLEQAFAVDKFNIRVANSLKVLRHLEKYETIESEHYVVRYDPVADKVLGPLVADYLEENYAILSRDFAYTPPDKFLVEIFSSHEMFSGRIAGLPDLHTVGACTGRVMAMASPTARGLARPYNWGRVVRHELVHLFNLSQTRFQVPHWFTEGLAVRNEGGAKPPSWLVTLRERHAAKTLLTLDNIQLGFIRPASPAEWGLAYCQANLYVEYILSAHGVEAIGKLLEAYRDGMSDAAAIARACKTDKESFEKGYSAFVDRYVKGIALATPRKDDVPMSLDELETAHADKPKDADVTARLADTYQRRRRPADARKLADAVLTTNPGHPVAAAVKARLLKQAGDDDAALEVIEKAVDANGSEPSLLLALAQARVERKEYVKAIALAERGRKLAPVDGNWLEILTEAYGATKQTEKLVPALVDQAAQDPDLLVARLALAKAHATASRFAEAETFAREVLFIDSANPEGRKIYLHALESQKKVTLAQKYRAIFEKE